MLASFVLASVIMASTLLSGCYAGSGDESSILRGDEASARGDLDAALAEYRLAVGRGSEGAVHSHARRALEEGIPAGEIMQIAVLAIPTVGLPGAVAALTWILDIVEPAN